MSVAKYYPFNGERGRLRLGLSAIESSEWLQYEDDFPERILEKEKIIKVHGKSVLDTMPGSMPAQQKFLRVVLENFQQHHADKFIVTDNEIVSKINNKKYCITDYKNNLLELVSYLVTDDFCLIEEAGEDYKLIAASVCAPTWWGLSEKMGKPLADIHSPIADLEEKIGRMIRHFLKNLKVNDCYQRSNWFLFTRPDLCVFPNSFDFYTDMTNINSENIATNLYLRSERQTFCKLKDVNSIAFGIKIYVEPISVVKKYPAIADDLVTALNTMTTEQKQALGISFVEKPLRAYLN
ncbi:MAG: heme-dependent oxidative N-demethylase family protein [Gammaproteobacteria bacterium]